MEGANGLWGRDGTEDATNGLGGKGGDRTPEGGGTVKGVVCLWPVDGTLPRDGKVEDSKALWPGKEGGGGGAGGAGGTP